MRIGPGTPEQVLGTSPQGPLGLRVPASRARVTSGSGREPSSVYFRPPAGLRPSEARAPRSHGLAHGVSGGGRRSAALRGAAANVGSVGRRAAGSRRGRGTGGRLAAAGCREAGRPGGRPAGERPGPRGAVPRGRGPSPRNDGPRVGHLALSVVGLGGACESSSAQVTFFQFTFEESERRALLAARALPAARFSTLWRCPRPCCGVHIILLDNRESRPSDSAVRGLRGTLEIEAGKAGGKCSGGTVRTSEAV